KPDLIVTAVWTVPTSPTEGQSYVMKATVKNQGTAAANPTGMDQYITTHFYMGSTDIGEETDWCTSIAINGTYTFTSGSKTAPTAGNYPIKAVADSQGYVAESNESNNHRTSHFTALFRSKPDLIVTAVWTEPASPTQGQSYVMKATVKN